MDIHTRSISIWDSLFGGKYFKGIFTRRPCQALNGSPACRGTFEARTQLTNGLTKYMMSLTNNMHTGCGVVKELNMPRNEWPTPSEMIVMRILQGCSAGAYGLEIVGDSEGAVKRGSVYVLLGRLEEKGFVRVLPSKKGSSSSAPARPQYQLTAEGSRVLSLASAIGMQVDGALA
jgi:hypothetical protein